MVIKNFYFGVSVIGIIAFVIQEIHYIIYSMESGKAITRWSERLRCFSFFIQ